jgi:acyl-CoA-binding protein
VFLLLLGPKYFVISQIETTVVIFFAGPKKLTSISNQLLLRIELVSTERASLLYRTSLITSGITSHFYTLTLSGLRRSQESKQFFARKIKKSQLQDFHSSRPLTKSSNGFARFQFFDDKVSTSVKLRPYALYKQATQGPCGDEVQGPPLFRFEAYSKHQAWKACRDLPKEAAMREYIELCASQSSELGRRCQAMLKDMHSDTDNNTAQQGAQVSVSSTRHIYMCL